MRPPSLVQLCLVLAATACGRREPELPEGAFLSGDVAAGRAFFEGLRGWEDTRLGLHADDMLARIGACDSSFTLAFPTEDPNGEGEGGTVTVTCAPVEGFEAFAAGRSLVFALARAPVGRLVGWIDAGEPLRVEARLPDPDDGGVWGALLPSRQSPGPLVLSDADALVHVRLRAARLAGLTELVESGGQGDAMFGLKGELFTNSVLDGTWEFVAYLPGGVSKLPRLALAIGVRSEDLARAALDAYIGTIERTWKVSMNRNLPGVVGCFDAVNMLPDLAPCGAIERGVLLIGWNLASVEQARAAVKDGGADEGSFARVNLGLFPEADREINAAFAPDKVAPQTHYPWSEVAIHATRDDEGVHLQLEARP